MIWRIPAKTFLLGEYASVAQGSALLVTTAPYFELSQSSDTSKSIHPDSPAGKWLKNHAHIQGNWFDPYQGQGGLGASSAQFIAVYLSTCEDAEANLTDLLEAYYQFSWSGIGLKPSGYDVIAQTQAGCVFINQANQQLFSYNWPFNDLSFILIHTGVKLATHHHLLETTLPVEIDYLSALADRGKTAFETADSSLFIECVNQYHKKLSELGLVAEHSQKLIANLNLLSEIKAVKGCGAMGADILLVICTRTDKKALLNKLKTVSQKVLATEVNLNHNRLLECR